MHTTHGHSAVRAFVYASYRCLFSAYVLSISACNQYELSVKWFTMFGMCVHGCTDQLQHSMCACIIKDHWFKQIFEHIRIHSEDRSLCTQPSTAVGVLMCVLLAALCIMQVSQHPTLILIPHGQQVVLLQLQEPIHSSQPAVASRAMKHNRS